MKHTSKLKEPTYLAMVVRTKTLASRALFLSSSPRMLRTFSRSHGDKSSKYWFKRLALLTSSGKTYQKWVSLKNKKQQTLSKIALSASKSFGRGESLMLIVSYIGDGICFGVRIDEAAEKHLWKQRAFILKYNLDLCRKKIMHTWNLWLFLHQLSSQNIEIKVNRWNWIEKEPVCYIYVMIFSRIGHGNI